MPDFLQPLQQVFAGITGAGLTFGLHNGSALAYNIGGTLLLSAIACIFIAICLAKAALTGTTEEICYRGIIQPMAIRHFGLPLAIILQSALYMAFHMHLGPAFVSRALFLPAVCTLGIIFGIVSYRTKGIGWAVLIHTALNIVIEWLNLC